MSRSAFVCVLRGGHMWSEDLRYGVARCLSCPARKDLR